jgi:hypothetical protein
MHVNVLFFKLKVYVSNILFKFCIQKVHSYLLGLCRNSGLVSSVPWCICSFTFVPHVLRFGYKASTGIKQSGVKTVVLWNRYESWKMCDNCLFSILWSVICFVCNHMWTFWAYYFLHVHIEQWLVSVSAIFNFWPYSRTLCVIVIFRVVTWRSKCVFLLWRNVLPSFVRWLSLC